MKKYNRNMQIFELQKCINFVKCYYVRKFLKMEI